MSSNRDAALQDGPIHTGSAVEDHSEGVDSRVRSRAGRMGEFAFR